MTRLEVRAVAGLPEVRRGDDLAELVVEQAGDLADGDVVVVTSKVVSKAEGRVVRTDRNRAIAAETVREVARREATTIARTRHGLTLAAAGVDESNTPPGTVVLLPADPDASARSLRESLARRAGRNVAVVVSDTAGRPWRTGQTDLAVGCAGLPPLLDLAGATDRFGRVLEVTAPAIADELAAAADLVMGKLGHRPAAVVRGLAALVLPPGRHGPGAAALLRGEDGDMFGLGAREAVHAAVSRDDPRALAAFGVSRHGVGLLRRLLETATAGADVPLELAGLPDGRFEVRGRPGAPTAVALERLVTLLAAHGWTPEEGGRNYVRSRLVVSCDDGP